MAFLSSQNIVPDIVAIVGVLIGLGGLHLLWLSRREIFVWVEEFFRLFRINVRQVADPAHPPLEFSSRLEKRHAVRIAIAFLMVFLIAPLLVTVGLAF